MNDAVAPLAPPVYLGTGTIITEDIIDNGTIYFTIPADGNATTTGDDLIYLMLNGIPVAPATKMTPADATLPHRMGANTTRQAFQFTGQARFTYQIDPANETDPNASTATVLTVVRADYPGPFNDPNGLPPPQVTPAKYNASNFQKGDQLTISIPMDSLRTDERLIHPLQAGDIIQPFLDLHATTNDKLPTYFYPVVIPPKTLSARDIAQTTLDFNIASTDLKDIDENTGYAYYLVFQGNFERQSHRTPALIDVVPPHS